jgi:hypothetical protein
VSGTVKALTRSHDECHQRKAKSKSGPPWF